MTLPLLLAAACVAPLPEPAGDDAPPLDVGETRAVELRSLALEVDQFEKRVDLEALRRLPPSVLEGIWLLDVPLEALVRNALDQLASTTLTEARQLPVPAQNMRRLLRMTPDDADLAGTSLEEMIALSAALGIPKGRALADLVQTGLTEPVIRRDVASEVLLDGLVATHPATWTRTGPVTPEHPDGVYEVAPYSVPVTLHDLVTGFASLAERFGPADTPLGRHPGFIEEATGFDVVASDFAMTVRVDVNALPFRGVDLTDGTDAAVNSTPRQAATMFPVDDPDWLVVEGLVDQPTIERLVVGIVEDGVFHAAAADDAPNPDPDLGPRGTGSAWSLPPWTFERMIGEMGHRAFSGLDPVCVDYTLGTGTRAFEACVDARGWTTFETFAGLGNPPAPTWLWDITAELAQVRLHDGGLPEGGADVAFALDDVPLGLDAETIAATARENLAANPVSLRELARVLTENSQGAADVYYVRGPTEPGGSDEVDWLVFLSPDDLALGDDGQPLRAYAYANPGFFADEALTQPVGAPEPGSPTHVRVAAVPGQVVFVEDDEGLRYRIEVGEKPSRARLALELTRIR